MEDKDLLALSPYALNRREKQAFFSTAMTALTHHHRISCPNYGRLLDVLNTPEQFPLEETPMLPVSLFKEMALCSVPTADVFKTVTSSGTTGQKVSQICLDARTSANQQKILYRIVSDFIGEKRLPLLILDSRNVRKDRAHFSARAAGILGFSMFGSRICYALNEQMELDLEGIRTFLAQYGNGPILVFGFTYLIWTYVCRVLEAQGERLELPDGILIHGGGWKKLQNQAVSSVEFKARMEAVTGIQRVISYYGMAEQTGGIFMECPYGHLHASVWSEVIPRRARDYTPCAQGEEGVIQLLSPLPWSYPGHSILTEDLGVVLGEDDCPCGRNGKYITITGRAPKAEIRGCSDTYEG